MIKKIWGDSVWSKVIANGISYVLGAILIFFGLWIKSKYDNVSVWESINTVYNRSIKLGWVIIGVVFLFLGRLIYRTFKSRSKKPTSDGLTKKQVNQNELRNFTKYNDTKIMVNFRWRVWFDQDTPFATDIVCYCSRHPVPLKMGRYGCIDNDCENRNLELDMSITTLAIESWLQNEYDLIIEKNK